MKFDMGEAWRDAMAMISANREVMIIVAGVFFFLPSLAAVLLVPGMQPPSGANQEQALGMMTTYYTQNAPIFLIMGLIQTVGFLALQALLRDDSKPTVGEALKIGALGLLPYIGAQILVALAMAVVFGALVGIPAAMQSQAATGIMVIVCIPIACYLFTKISLLTPIIAIEKVMNPITALKRSWGLTKGNSFRIFLFYFLILLAFIVISLVAGIVFGLIVALLGEGTAGLIVNGIFSGLVGAAATLVFVGVLAAVHRQLAGPSTERITETFD